MSDLSPSSAPMATHPEARLVSLPIYRKDLTVS